MNEEPAAEAPKKEAEAPKKEAEAPKTEADEEAAKMAAKDPEADAAKAKLKEEAAKKKADENKPDEPTGVKEEPVKPADPNADPLDAGAAEAAEAKKLKA